MRQRRSPLIRARCSDRVRSADSHGGLDVPVVAGPPPGLPDGGCAG
ncbi:hypothetical protein NSERUTF1_1462 [Nocardia seriolae]|nr:hypothetical protein NSERUTF1_1462 [Nocardia seriolae]